MAAYVLEALANSRWISERIYVGSTTPEVRALTTRTLNSGPSLAASLSIGLNAAVELRAERVLVVSADLPWLTTEAINTFIERSPKAALVYPVIAKEVAERQFPGQKRTYAKLKDGAFTGGNLMLLEPRILPTLLPFVNRAYEGRKNPLSLARLLGFRFALSFLAGRLEIRAMERRIGEVLGMEVRAYRSPDASLGADVDRLEHLDSAG